MLFKASSILQVLECKNLKCIHLNTFPSALPTTLHYPFWYWLQMIFNPGWLLPTNKNLDTIFTLPAPITWLCLGNYNYSDPAFGTSSEHKASLYDWGWGGRLPGSTAKGGWLVSTQATEKEEELEPLWWPSGLAQYCWRGFTWRCPAEWFCKASVPPTWGEEGQDWPDRWADHHQTQKTREQKEAWQKKERTSWSPQPLCCSQYLG